MTDVATATPDLPQGVTEIPEEEATRPIALEGVYIGNVSPGTVSTHFANSLHELRSFDTGTGLNTIKGVLNAYSGAQISKSRNDIVNTFLSVADEPDGEAEWLLFLDSDMTFPPDMVVRLQSAARHAKADIIGGLCVMVTDMGPIPTLYQWDKIPGSKGFTRVQFEYPKNTLLQVAATGTACMMIRKSLLKRMRDASGSDFSYFSEMLVKRSDEEHWISEDISFCVRAGQLEDTRIFVDTSLLIGHAKHGRIWTAEDIEKRTGMSSPAIVAVIPQKDKAHLTAALVRQLKGSRVDKIYVIDNGSVERSSREILKGFKADPQLSVFEMPDAGIHEMWNAGALSAIAEFGPRTHIAFLNNDIDVCPDFLPLLSWAILEHPEFMCVGGNYDERTSVDRSIIETDDICGGRYDGTGGLPGFAFMLRGEYFTGGYRFPEQMTWWFGDNDLVLSLIKTQQQNPGKYKIGIALPAGVEHLDTTGKGPGGGTVDGDWSKDNDRVAILGNDYREFYKKWSPVVKGLMAPSDMMEADTDA